MIGQMLCVLQGRLKMEQETSSPQFYFLCLQVFFSMSSFNFEPTPLFLHNEMITECQNHRLSQKGEESSKNNFNEEMPQDNSCDASEDET